MPHRKETLPQFAIEDYSTTPAPVNEMFRGVSIAVEPPTPSMRPKQPDGSHTNDDGDEYTDGNVYRHTNKYCYEYSYGNLNKYPNRNTD